MSSQLEIKKDEECKAEFNPVVDLSSAPEYTPENVEEKEDIFYEQRVRALRFDSEANDWKERGIGILRILREKENPSKFRILMRREKILKVCLNHALLPEMHLTKNVGSSKTWMYFTPADVSDGEPKNENLAIMFKTDELAEEFKSKFEEAISIIKKAKSEESNEGETKESEEKTEE